MNSDWTPQSVDRLRAWREEILQLAAAHAAAAKKYALYHRVLLGLQTCLSAATGAVGLTAPCPTGPLVAGLAGTSASLAGLSNVVAFDVRSERHDRSADDLGSVARFIEYQLSIGEDVRDQAKTVFVYVSSRLDSVEAVAPLV